MEKTKHWWCKDCPHEKCPCPFPDDLKPCYSPAEQCPEKAPVEEVQ